MKIYLIRHGESVSDIKQKYDGEYDDPLTEKGMDEARSIADKLRKSGVEIVFSSPKIRAKETSKVIHEALDCDIQILDDLAEQNIYGAYPELGKDHPEEEYRKLGEVLANRGTVTEGAETYADFKQRVTRGFSEVMNDNHEIVAIVTHGGPIRFFFREILKRGEIKSVRNGAIIELEKNESGLEIVKLDGVELE
jgi:broad specificity phosphatase PhoE